MAEFMSTDDNSSSKSTVLEDSTDKEFEPTADMLVHDFDDEQTLAEEEAIALAGGEDPDVELSNLQKEGDMPIEELMALYGYGADRQTVIEAEPEDLSSSDSSEDITPPIIAIIEETKEPIDTAKLPEEAPPSVADPTPSLLPQGTTEKPHRHRPARQSDLRLLYSDQNLSTSNTARLLRSGLHAASDEDGEEGEDYDYTPDDDEWRKTIMIGSDYQAAVPVGLGPYGDSLPYENEDKLLWSPSLDDLIVEAYLSKCQILARQIQAGLLPRGSHIRDDEQALYQLLQCGHNVEEALRRRRMNAVATSDTMSLWSEEECRNFELGLRTYGKDFHLIQQHKVRTRAVGELVQFYYLWKKTERHDIFANRARLEKKKYALHPGTTDYMDRFLDEDLTTGTVLPVLATSNGQPGVVSPLQNNGSSPAFPLVVTVPNVSAPLTSSTDSGAVLIDVTSVVPTVLLKSEERQGVAIVPQIDVASASVAESANELLTTLSMPSQPEILTVSPSVPNV